MSYLQHPRCPPRVPLMTVLVNPNRYNLHSHLRGVEVDTICKLRSRASLTRRDRHSSYKLPQTSNPTSCTYIASRASSGRFRLCSVLDMARLWLICMFTLVIITRVTGKQDQAVSDSNFGLQTMSANGTGCMGDPRGDRLKDLCDTLKGVTCCLYRHPSGTSPSCGVGLCLSIGGGNGTFLRRLFQQLPADNITFLFLSNADLSDQPGHACENFCMLPNLKRLNFHNTVTRLDTCTCLTQLTHLAFEGTHPLLLTATTLQGLSHLVSLSIMTPISSLSTDGMMQLQAAKELNSIDIAGRTLAVLDVWPLCLAQTRPGIFISFEPNTVMDFTNTLSPSRCDIDTTLGYSEIDLESNSIAHVSDIASGWGFHSLHHFITSVMVEHSVFFPIDLEGNPFSCDCTDIELYRILRDPRYNKRLVNLVNLTCASPLKLRGRRFETLLDSELDCASLPLPLILGVSVSGIVVLVAAVLGFLFYNRIRLYRWSGHKLHPWDRDECVGENKEFDVFISHASEDEEWTLQLIEDLESRGFKVCFHKRDFEPGVTIIDNIMMAVDKSKRTICILSPSFAASPWCSWEFITVFSDDIEEHQRRLLLVVKEGVAWESLSLAMQRYMRDFTYIDTENPYFMDNLLYSLPVTRLGEAREARAIDIGRDCQPVTSDTISDTGHTSAGERTPLLQVV